MEGQSNGVHDILNDRATEGRSWDEGQDSELACVPSSAPSPGTDTFMLQKKPGTWTAQLIWASSDSFSPESWLALVLSS